MNTLVNMNVCNKIVVEIFQSGLNWWRDQQTFPSLNACMANSNLTKNEHFLYLQESGLSKWLGQSLAPLQQIPPYAISLLLSLLVATFTECSSNTATTTLFLPILASMVNRTQLSTCTYTQVLTQRFHVLNCVVLACFLGHSY